MYGQYGDIHVKPYPEFLSMPYVDKVKGRKFDQTPPDIIEKTVEFMDIINQKNKNLKTFWNSRS